MNRFTLNGNFCFKIFKKYTYGKNMFLQHEKVCLCVNRQGTTRSLSLQALATDILTLAELHKIHLRAYHLPGRFLLAPDALSRPSRPHPEWHLLPATAS